MLTLGAILFHHSAQGQRSLHGRETWKVFDEVTATFLALSTGPVEVNDENVATLERFTILLCGRTSSMVNIDEARQELFTKKGGPMDAIPPTKAALVQHIKRAVYQGGHCWGKMLQTTMFMPSAVDPQQWKPLWMVLPEASTAARELIRCGCKKRMCRKMQVTSSALLCVSVGPHVWDMTIYILFILFPVIVLIGINKSNFFFRNAKFSQNSKFVIVRKYISSIQYM